MAVLDSYGRAVRKSELTTEIAGPTIGGVRSPLTSYPGDGLDPRRLGAILREADAGDPLRFLELAETIEERDPHYIGVLGTRRRSVTQLDITVKEASETPQDVEIAKDLRNWLERDELQDELFDVLDAIGKGYSFTEIIWDYSERQWDIARLERRDQRWFAWDRIDLTTPLLMGPSGERLPLPGFKFIDARIKAKSGIPARSGLARVVMWPYLFKKYTERDWSIFSQTFGQPLRVGKYGAGASKEDRATLMRAVANIAGDCAAIIPEGMLIEFIESGNVGAAHSLYKERGDWYDKQVSKAVLGQTATTDAETGGLGSGTEHRLVQEDIERADAKALSAILNRDLVRPFVTLNYGEAAAAPRIVIARPEAEDLVNLSKALSPLIDRGLEVDAEDMRGKFGLKAPKAGAKLLRPMSKAIEPKTGETPAPEKSKPAELDANSSESEIEYPFKRHWDQFRYTAPLTTQRPPEGRSEPLPFWAQRLTQDASPAMEEMLGAIEAMIEAAGSLEELQATLLSAYPDLPSDSLTMVLAQAMVTAQLGGRAAVVDQSDG